ncbi:immunity protein Imm33 domain-containing protein [Mucilaginibacter gilvus]|uniref:DUF2185 domain-containing protein n=1 Tax=Mucilaginibacter gilvus TaxID=2305909 RepID=A0A3S3YV38_9SPHI|nr:DUF2185 domain-containing protein [Mucilaginibacter gilvus]RWY50958.1 DUF2185 domain-containing protein [Mucilaginibacter gilvus]
MDLIMGAILVSNKILINTEAPAWMYRENPIVFSGSEDETHLNNPLNLKTVSAEQLIKIGYSLKANLFAPISSSFEMNNKQTMGSG